MSAELLHHSTMLARATPLTLLSTRTTMNIYHIWFFKTVLVSKDRIKIAKAWSMDFFGVKTFFFATSCGDIVFFFYENKFFSGVQCFQNILFCPCQRQKLFSIKISDNHPPPPKKKNNNNIALPLQVEWTATNDTSEFKTDARLETVTTDIKLII